MSDPWISLRDFYASWVDDMIAAEPDAEARAMFEASRDQIVNLVEGMMRRRIEQQESR